MKKSLFVVLIALLCVSGSCSNGSTDSADHDTTDDAVNDTVDTADSTPVDDVEPPDDALEVDDADDDTEVATDDADASELSDADDAAAADDVEDVEDVEPPPDPLTVDWCFRAMLDPERPGPNYQPFEPTVGSHCLGTNHQDIQGVQKLVFFGDSVTKGTPPTLPEDYFRSLVADGVRERFGDDIIVEDFSRFGARVDDLLLPSDEQFRRAFPDVEPLTTLAVFTVGGNDIFKWAEMASEEATIEEIEAVTDEAIRLLEDALAYLADPDRFPNGIYVIFSNVYEYTDATGDTASCPLAEGIGLGNAWPEGRGPVVRFNEAFMRLAVEHRFDLIFMLERFCGHGFHKDNPESQCYKGPDTEQYFDFTCIHPTPTGHRVIADMVLAVVDE